MRRKQDLEIEEMCSEKVILLSKMTPKLRAEVTGERVTLLGREMIELVSLASCCGKPMRSHSVLAGVRERRLADIH